MATEVTRSLKEIREQVVALDKDVKALSRDNRNLIGSLKLDPTSTVLLSEKQRTYKSSNSFNEKVQELRKANKCSVMWYQGYEQQGI